MAAVKKGTKKSNSASKAVRAQKTVPVKVVNRRTKKVSAKKTENVKHNNNMVKVWSDVNDHVLKASKNKKSTRKYLKSKNNVELSARPSIRVQKKAAVKGIK